MSSFSERRALVLWCVVERSRGRRSCRPIAWRAARRRIAKSAMAASPPPAARSTARKQASSAGAYAALPRALVGEHHGRTPLYLVVVYVLFKWALPALAALTPPGINPREVIRVADDDALAGWYER